MRLSKRHGVSELYASLMMIGVTLSFGSVVTIAAVNQFNLSSNSASLGILVQEASAGKQISLVYGTVPYPGTAGCPSYHGYTEGKSYTLALYDYGSVAFTPGEIFINGSLIAGGPYGTLSAGSMTVLTLTLGSCAHPAGQTFLLVDASGDEVQVGN
ncbi:MAG: hypothetical protein ABSB26_03760 [Nitrososphaerales archaeon]